MTNSTEGFRHSQSKSWRGQDCRGMDFSGRDLCNADFTDAILDGVDFSGADLRGATFRRSSLVGANLNFSKSGIPRDRAVILQAILLALTVLLGLFTGHASSSLLELLTNESKVFTPYYDIKFLISWQTFSGLLAIIYGIVFGLMVVRKNLSTAILIGISSVIIIDIVGIGIVVYASILSNQSWEVAGDMVIGLSGSAIMIIFQATFTMTCLSIIINILTSNLQVLIAVAIGVTIDIGCVLNAGSSQIVLISTIIISGSMVYVSFKLGNPNRSREAEYSFINLIATYISTYYGTCFHQANLTNATLAHALLTSTNLSGANLNNTNIYGVQNLNSAKTDRTILANSIVRDLLVTHQGRSDNYLGYDFHGAYLVNANLIDVDFTSVNLSNADLSGARLDNANFTRVVAIGTNFQRSTFTGICIKDWSIDRTTNLTDIQCDYIYLKSPTEERTPASGSFNPGGFTRLFQEVWNTVDLIFDRGIDWLTFSRAWQQIQIEYAGDILEVNSIERKGEGTIVVKVEVPRMLDKGRFHQDFDRYYQLGLATATDRYRSELEGKDREITIYREQQANLQSLLQSLVKPAVITGNTERVVFLKLADRDLHGEIDVRVEIADRGATPRWATTGKLTNIDEIWRSYTTWQTSYDRYIEGTHSRIDIARDRPTNLTDRPVIRDCQIAAQNLKQQLNICLDRSEFKPIKELMLQELHPSQSIQIIIQTDNLQIRQLPWQLWNLLETFRQAEITFASHTYQARERDRSPLQPLQVLAIIGNSEGIDVTVDRQLLTTLPNANVELAISPSRQMLNDKIWEKAWDIIFFAGHSSSDRNLERGYIELNRHERASIAELKYAFQKAIDRGLKLVMLNSCDGWGLATELIDLQLAQAIFMREPIPDLVAQQFLRHFLTAFTNGLPLYLAVREAREKLQGLEDQYPCATWLPVICQNPSNIGAEL
jgi:uncharacterized protein YjbI with pentapeptide repeats